MKTIKDRATDCLVHINGMTQGDAIRHGIEIHLLGLLQDIKAIIDDVDIHTRKEILEKIGELTPPASERPAASRVEARGRKIAKAYKALRQDPRADLDDLKALFKKHLGKMVEACADVVDERRRAVVRQCGGDVGLIASPDSMTFTGYSVATMLAQLSDAIRGLDEPADDVL